MSEQGEKAPFRVGQRVRARPGFWFIDPGEVKAAGFWGDPGAWWVTLGFGAGTQVVPAWKLEADD